MPSPSPLSEVAQKQLDQLKSLCPMRLSSYQIGSFSVHLWTACDIDPLLNQLMEKEESHPDVIDERMPYWAELWPSSLLMAETIAARASSLPQGHWIEWGCGPGLPGLLAAKAGRPGIFSDYMQEALWLSRLNALQNECSDQTEFIQLDWRTPPADLKADWILAGDVAYEKRNFEPLFETFRQLLTQNGEIWLGEPGRPIAESFFLGMEDAGWRREILNRREDLRVHRFTRF
ncbi:MAG: class I SAM-dependent methyltransferase [Kiritimatiellia bacterium]